MNTTLEKDSVEQRLFRHYHQALFAFENIDQHPDTPWLVEEYINSTLSLSQVLALRPRQFLLLKSYRSVLSMIRNQKGQHCLRQHALNQVHRLLNELHICLSPAVDGQYQINLLHQELTSIRI
jgi:hypothetical protein